MTKKNYIHITIISAIVGFMLAVLYNTTQSPENKENADVWEIRQQLSEEKKIQSEYLHAIRNANDKIAKYENDETESPHLILQDTLEGLRQQIGIDSVQGSGLEIEIEPSVEAIAMGFNIEEIPPSLLIRLVNDMYRYKAQYVEIDGKRLTYSTAIRDINGKTTVNSEPIDKSSTVIKVITESAELTQKLYNHLLASTFADEFYIDNFSFSIGQPTTVELSNLDVNLKLQHLQQVKGE